VGAPEDADIGGSIAPYALDHLPFRFVGQVVGVPEVAAVLGEFIVIIKVVDDAQWGQVGF
jgi:hypothetical protein